jgi:hypothetical protein
VAEHFPKASLVVVKPLLALVIYGADVHDYVASIKDSRVAGAFDVWYTALVERHATYIVWRVTCVTISLREP